MFNYQSLNITAAPDHHPWPWPPWRIVTDAAGEDPAVQRRLPAALAGVVVDAIGHLLTRQRCGRGLSSSS